MPTSQPAVDGVRAGVPSAFISWAHESVVWERTVLDFATALRVVACIDADLDLWHLTDHVNWTAYGPALIRDSSYILLAVSTAFKDRWQSTNAPTTGAGAAREAAAIKAIFERDQAAFVRRVKVVVLPGASTDDIPDDLLGIAQRFTVSSLDMDGLTDLQLTLYGHAKYPKPPLPPLPPGFMSEVRRDADGEAVGGRPVPAERDWPSDEPNRCMSQEADVLEARLVALDAALGSLRAEADQAAEEPWSDPWDALRRERSIVQSSLDALIRRRHRS